MSGVSPQRVSFHTEDGVEIVGSLYGAPVEEPRFAILLHMMRATKENWDAFAQKLVAAGYTTLAIDERGHGESIVGAGGVMLDYKVFSSAEQQAKRLDVEATFAYLQTRGAREENTVLVGASIGANLAIRFAAEHAGVTRVAALSPGLDYRGVTTEDAFARLREGQRVLLVASDDDDRDAFASAARLRALRPDESDLFARQGLGHGTHMFDATPQLMDEIIAWL